VLRKNKRDTHHQPYNDLKGKAPFFNVFFECKNPELAPEPEVVGNPRENDRYPEMPDFFFDFKDRIFEKEKSSDKSQYQHRAK
jgi:hypothetical protein